MQPQPTTACLTEDELLSLGRGGSLSDAPALEAHLADCATCSALLATVVSSGEALRSNASHEHVPVAPWNALAGKRLGPYRLDAQIGAGGMGAVYRAWDTRLDRAIAIKVLHATSDAPRLAAEARAAATIDHPAIVAVHDVGVSDDGIAYVAMELVEGEALRSVVERGPVPLERARELAAELADGLAAAHARGVVHRDLKPENLVVARGRIRILDFGLAKLVDGRALDETEPRAIHGTAGYMAPEQARGEPTDARADLFSVGAIIYELVTGKRAFPGATHAERLTAILRDTPPLDALGPLAPIIGRCLAKEPGERFHSAADLAWVLRTPGPAAAPARISRRGILVGAGAALVASAGGFWLGRRRTAAPSSHPAFQQLTYRTGRVYTARFTRDGGRMIYGAAWDGEPLRGYLADLRGGSSTALEVAGDVLALSSLGELAVARGKRFTDHQSATGTLAVVPLGGGAPRTLADDVQDADYAPDGRLAIIRRGGAGFRLELPLGTVIVETAGWITHARVSPDGRHVAYVQHPHSNDDTGDLMVADVTSRQTRKLVGGFESIAGLAWDGDTIWFTAARGSAHNEVHTITLDGPLRSIAQATGRLRLHDVAAGRRALVTLDVWRLRMLAGDRERSLSDISFVNDISADGTTLVVGELGNPEAARGAYLVPIDGGERLRLGDGFPLAISPSGQRIAANVGDQLVVYSTASGERPAIVTPGLVGACRWIDEASLVAVAGGRLWRLALGAAPVRLADRARGPLAIDPGRQRCAFVVDGALHVVELASGTLRALRGDSARSVVCGWLADPDAIVLGTPTTPIELTRVDPATGAISPHQVIEPPPVGLKAVDSVVVHDRRIAYSYGQELSQLFLLTV